MGCNHVDNHLQNLKDQNQVGTFFLMGIDDNIVTKNEIYLAYKIIYNIYKKLKNQDPNFLSMLKGDINLEIDTQNYIHNNQLITENNINKFLENLKVIYKRRLLELFPQYYFDNKSIFNTEMRQRLYDLVFSNRKRTMNQKEELNYLRDEFSTFGNIKIFVGSWNTGNTNLDSHEDLDLDSWLKPKNEKIIPNIYFIGLQEVVELNTANVISNSDDKQKVLKDWAKKIEKTTPCFKKNMALVWQTLICQ
jgi:hypothetical protein